MSYKVLTHAEVLAMDEESFLDRMQVLLMYSGLVYSDKVMIASREVTFRMCAIRHSRLEKERDKRLGIEVDSYPDISPK